MLFTMSCSSDDDYIPLKQQTKQQTQAPLEKYKYSVYLENSGSLNGYLKATGDSNFKSNVYGLITLVNTAEEKQTLSLYDVNTKIIPVFPDADASQVNEYITNLNEITFRKRSKEGNGNQSLSDLQAVLKMILDTTGTHEVSVLISDGIFSPGKNRNAEDYLSQQQYGIQNFITDKLNNQPLSMLVLQFESEFKGRYYYQDNSSKDGTFSKRPYYVICMGPEAALQDLLHKVEAQSTFKGFRNFMFLLPSKKYDVRPQICNATEYYEYDMDVPLTVSNIEQGGRDHKFRIKLGMDFSKLPVSESYLRNRDHYTVSNGYTIESITPSGKEGYTHEILLVTDKAQTGKLTFSLKKQLPAWIEDSNLNTDQGLTEEALSGKTFGIRYLLKGIYNAYYDRDKQSDYFSITISVKE
jgi:hypothetical protein